MSQPDSIQQLGHSLSDIKPSRRMGPFIGFGSLFIAAAALILAASPNGIGITHDSVFYLTSAENLTTGLGLSWPASGGELRPLTHFAPLYPMTLSLLVGLGVPSGVAARWIAGLAFGANVVLVGILTMHYSRRLWAGFLASGFALISVVILGVHVIALSEPLFFLLLLASLFAIAKYSQNPSRRTLIIAALLAGLSHLTRYVGVVVVGTGILSLFLIGNRRRFDRLKDAVLFGITAFAPGALWMIRNFLLTGTATNRTFRFHPPQRIIMEKLADTLVGWSSPFDLPPAVDYLLLLTFGLVIVVGIWRLGKQHESSTGAACSFAFVLLLFNVLYVGSLLISITFFDASTPIDNRILAPVYVVTLILAILLVSLTQKSARLIVAWRAIFLVIFAVVALNQGADSFRTLRTLYETGFGFSSETWRNSRSLAWVRKLPQNASIYTNERLAITYLTGRSAYEVPEKYDSVKAQVRPEFEREFETMQARLKDPETYLVLFNPYNLKWGLPTRDEITFPLAALERFDDAVIYVNPVNLD